MKKTHKRTTVYRLQIVDFSNDCIDVDLYSGDFQDFTSARNSLWETYDLVNDYNHSGFFRLMRIHPGFSCETLMLIPYGKVVR